MSPIPSTTDTLTIREMCEAFAVTPRTLRFYEAKELLFPIRKGTARLFTKQDRARLLLILRGKRFGFSLEDIRQLLDMYDRDGSNEAQARQMIAAQASRAVRLTRADDVIDNRDEGQSVAAQVNRLHQHYRRLGAMHRN